MTSWNRTLLALGMALVLTGCFSKAELPPVVVGHVSILSGPDSAPASFAAARAIRLAVEEANRDPEKGIGRQVQVRHTDTRGALPAFESEAVRLVTINRAVALLGGASAAEVERLERAHVPVVAPDGVRTRAMSDFVFLTGLSPRFQGQVLARFAAQDLAATSAAACVDEDREEALQLGEAFVNEFPAAVSKHDPRATAPRPMLWRFSKDARLDELAARVREARPAVLLVGGSAGTLRDFLAVLGQPTLPVLFGNAEEVPVLSVDGKTTNPVYQPTAFVHDADTPRTRAFVEQYQKAFGEAPDVRAALAYDGARLLFEALHQADNHFSSGELKDRLAGLKDFPGLAGPLSFDKDHQLRRPAFVVRVEKGQAHTVKRFGAEP